MNHEPTTLKPAEYGRTVYSHAVAQGNDYEKDVLKPEYWVHVAGMLKAGDRIEVTGHAGAYFAELYVVNVNAIGARVAELFKTEIKINAVAETDHDDPDYAIKMRGPRKWSILRKADNSVVKEDIATREDAVDELTKMRQAIAA